MKSMQQFNDNMGKIDALAINLYEKDVLRSAYYNHINNIPIARHALELLKKHNIAFRNGDIDISNMDREQRKKQYKRRSDSSINPKGAYSKSFLHANKQNTLTQMLARVEIAFEETQNFIDKCEELTSACFNKKELSYNMTKNMTDKLRNGSQTLMKTFSDFLQPFLENFNSLQPMEQKNILEQANDFIIKMEQTKDTSIRLCIELSKIRAHQIIPSEQDYIKYINNTINQFDNYIR